MSRWTWIFYLIGAALVFGSWIGVVSPALGWLGWLVATGIALASWFAREKAPQEKALTAPETQAAFSHEEMRAARREIDEEAV